jgi:hypothetical protein
MPIGRKNMGKKIRVTKIHKHPCRNIYTRTHGCITRVYPEIYGLR